MNRNFVRKLTKCIGIILLLWVFWIGYHLSQSEKPSNRLWIASLYLGQFTESTHNKSLIKLEEIHDQRRRFLREMCHHYFPNIERNDTENIRLKRMIVDDKHKLIYCAVPKVGCTNWKRILLKLTGKSNITDISLIDHIEAHRNKVFDKLSDLQEEKDVFDRLGHYLKFFFVRHPFERLVSAYRDKFFTTNDLNAVFHRLYGRPIIKQYRPNASDESLSGGHDVKFPEFVRYLIDRKSEAANYNVHWRPMLDLCSPCHVHYDIIGKYETLTEDASFVLNKAGVGDIVHYPKSDNFGNTSALVEQYMKMLTSEERYKLYKIYEKDYKLFNYSFNG